jgi:hypothetical protein
MTEKRTHKCTSCGIVKEYDNKTSWFNARTKLNKTGIIMCQPCAGKTGRNNSDKKIPGRPKGSKTNHLKIQNHSRKGAGARLNNELTFEQRMKGIARRNGYETYQDYQESLPEWKKYKIDVWRITNQQPIYTLEHFDKRGVNGQDGAYTLDHIISIKRGFIENISPENIGNINNLQMLPWEENINKGWK